MNLIIEYFFIKPVTTVMLFSGLSVWGLVSLNLLPVSLMPPTESPAISIITRYPGISPSKIEEILTKPLEEQIVGVGGIESIYSTSEEGESRINISFSTGSNISKKSLETRARIDLIRSTFPREVEEPAIIRYDPTDRPVFIVKLESDQYSLKELRDIAEYKIKKRLERVDGISEINVGGGYQREIDVEIDQGRFNFLGLKIADVMNMISSSNVNLPVGKILQSDKFVPIRIIGRFDKVESIKNVFLYSPAQDKIIRISDIATVRDGFRDKENISRENGKEIVSIYVQKAGDANTLSVCDDLAEEVEVIQFPGITKSVTYNQSEFIRVSINRVASTAASGGIIAIIVLFLFLKNWKATILIGVSIPLSVVVTFGIMYAYDIGVNVMSLSGLALGVGMMVDSSIVVIDRIFALNEKSGFHRDIPALAVKSVAIELLASIVTSIAVFFPIFFASEQLKQLYGGLALTVSGSLVVSLIVSLILIPVFSSRLLKREEDFKDIKIVFPKKLQAIFESLKKYIPERYLKYFNPSDFSMEGVKNKYFIILKNSFKNERKILIGLLAATFLSIVAVFFLKQEYVDPLDTGEIRASVELPTGTHLEATDKIIKTIELDLKEFKQVDKVSSKVEKWHADIYIKLKGADERDQSASEMIDLFKKKTDAMESAFVYYVESGDNSGSKELDVEFIGDDSEKLKEIAKEAAKLGGQVEGIQQMALRFREGKDEIRLDFDHIKASLNGISASNLGSTLKTAVQGSIPSKFLYDGREVDIKVRFQESDRSQLEQVYNYKIPGNKASLSVRELVTTAEGMSESKIYRKNKRKVVSITAKLGDIDMGNAVKKLDEAFAALKLPQNYYYEYGGNYKKLKENQMEMIFLVLLAFFLIYCILASLFESVTYPLIIIISIPLAISGVILSLFIFNMSLNISVYIGSVMLVGIVVNNSILLVESMIHVLASKQNIFLSKEEVITNISEACLDRLRPIMITTLTTVLGLLPTAFDHGEGSQLWRPLAFTVVTGLTISTVLTLVVVPMAFARFYLWRSGNDSQLEAVEVVATKKRITAKKRKKSPEAN